MAVPRVLIRALGRGHRQRAPAAAGGKAALDELLLAARPGVPGLKSPDTPLVLGPWTSEVGYEILYWRPMLTRLLERHGVMPARVTAISRGGVEPWYRELARVYRDVLDVCSPDELRAAREARVAATGLQKPLTPDPHEEALATRLGHVPGAPGRVDSSLVFRAFRPVWSGELPPRVIEKRVAFRPVAPAPALLPADLPEDYVALKAYWSRCLPRTPANEQFLAGLVRRLSAHGPVVLLGSPAALDEHTDAAVAAERVIDARVWMTPRDNLGVQTEIIRGARALVSTYGGFSYLGPFVGTPSVCFWSEHNFNPVHLDVMRQATDALPGRPSFVALATQHARLLDGLIG